MARRRSYELSLQLALARFLQPTENEHDEAPVFRLLGEAPARQNGDATLDSQESEGSQRDPRIPDPESPVTMDDWLASIGGHMVEVPGNGSYFYYALHAVKNRHITYKKIHTSKQHAREAAFYRRNVLEMLAEVLDEWVLGRTAHLEPLLDRYLPGSKHRGADEQMQAIRAFLASSGRRGVAQMAPLQY